MSRDNMINSLPAPDQDLTQIIVVTTAGTPVQGPDVSDILGWYLKASVENTGIIYFMYHGQTKANKGFPLSPGDMIFVPVENLNSLDFDSSVNGEKIHASKY